MTGGDGGVGENVHQLLSDLELNLGKTLRGSMSTTKQGGSDTDVSGE